MKTYKAKKNQMEVNNYLFFYNNIKNYDSLNFSKEQIKTMEKFPEEDFVLTHNLNATRWNKRILRDGTLEEGLFYPYYNINDIRGLGNRLMSKIENPNDWNLQMLTDEEILNYINHE